MGRYTEKALSQLEAENPRPESGVPDNTGLFSEAVLRAIEQTRERSSVMSAVKVNPDTHAKVVNLSERIGLPTDLVVRNEQQVTEQQEFAAIDFEDLQKNYPEIASRLRDLDFATMARDDLDTLRPVVDTVRSMANYLREIPRQVEAGTLRQELGALSFRRLEAHLGVGEQLTPDEMERVRALRVLTRGFQHEYNGFWEGVPLAVAEQVPNLKEQILTRAAWGGIGGLMGVAAGPGGIARGAGIGAKVGGFKAGVELEAGPLFDEFLQVTDDAGTPINQDVAAGMAVVGGAINGWLESFSFGMSLKTLQAAKGAVKAKLVQALGNQGIRQALGGIVTRYGAAVATEAATEALQELPSIVGEELGKAFSFEDESISGAIAEIVSPPGLRQMVQRMAEAGRQGAQVAVGIGGAGSAVSVARVRAQDKRAKAHVADLQETASRVKDSKLFQRHKGHFERLAQLAEEGGTDPDVFVSLEGLQASLAAEGVDPRPVLTELGVVAQTAEAGVAGTDLRVPISRFFSLSDRDYFDVMLVDVRETQAAPTAREAAERVGDLAPEEVEAAPTPEGLAGAQAQTAEIESRLLDEATPAEDVAPEVDPAERARVRAEVQAEVEQRPFFQARAALLDGELDPELIADQYGFTSRQELEGFVEDFSGFERIIEDETDRRMGARPLDPFGGPEQVSAVQDPVMTDERAASLGNELGQLRGLAAVGPRREDLRGRSQLTNVLDQLRATGQVEPPKGLKRPVIALLKERGGVIIGSPLAVELENLGVTTKTAPGLFTHKRQALAAADNIHVDDAPVFQALGREGLIDEQDILDGVAAEMRGEPLQTERQLEVAGELSSLANDVQERIDELGLDLATLSNAEAIARLGGVGTEAIAPIVESEDSPKVMKRRAEEQVEQMLVNELRPSRFLEAGRRAGEAALRASNALDYATAAKLKNRQMLNHFLYVATKNAEETSNRIWLYMKTFDRAVTRGKLGRGGVLEQIDGLRDRFDFRRSTSLTASEQRKSFVEWVTEQRDLGETVLVEWAEEEFTDDDGQRAHRNRLFREGWRPSYKELTFEELKGLRDTVKNIETVGRNAFNVLTDAEGRSFDEAKATLVATVDANHTIPVDPVNHSPGMLGMVSKGLNTVHAWHLKMEFLFDFLDGNPEKSGDFWTLLFKPMADAENAENAKNRESAGWLDHALRRYTRLERAQWSLTRTHVPEVNKRFTKAEMLMIALNWGNAGNRTALKDGFDWNDFHVAAVFKHLDKRDWDTVQDIWDVVSRRRDEIQALQKELTGVPLDMVEAEPFTTPAREMKGGYFPITFDPERSYLVFKRAERANAAELKATNFLTPHTKAGHREARIGSGGNSVLLDFSVLTNHLKNVNHDLTHTKAVRDVDRLTQDPDVRAAIQGAAGTESYKVVRPWIQAIAQERREPDGPIGRFLGHSRTSATVMNMGWKVTTAIVQPLGYLQTIDVIGEKYAWQGLQRFYGHGAQGMVDQVQFVHERSEQMKGRQRSFDRDIADAARKSQLAGLRADVDASFFYFIGLMDQAVSVPTWLGAYAKSMDEIDPGNEAAAIDFADKAVRKSQSAGGTKDLAAVQRGGEFQRMFTMFYSYFSVLYNLMAERTTQAKRRGMPGAPQLIASAMYLWVAPAVMSELVAGRGPAEGEDWDEWAARKAPEVAIYPLQTVVLARDIAQSMATVYGFSLPQMDAFGSLGQAVTQIVQLEGDKALARSLVNVTGFLARLPSRQMWIWGENLYDYANGDESAIALRNLFGNFAQQKKRGRR